MAAHFSHLAPRLLIVEFDKDLDPRLFAEAVHSASPTHVLFTRNEVPAELAVRKPTEETMWADMPAVESESESLTHTRSTTAGGSVYYSRHGVVLLRDESPFLIAPPAPLTDDADVEALLGESNRGVAAAIRLPGPTEPIADPVEIRRCPGPEPHWCRVRASNLFCPEHNLRLD